MEIRVGLVRAWLLLWVALVILVQLIVAHPLAEPRVMCAGRQTVEPTFGLHSSGRSSIDLAPPIQSLLQLQSLLLFASYSLACDQGRASCEGLYVKCSGGSDLAAKISPRPAGAPGPGRQICLAACGRRGFSAHECRLAGRSVGRLVDHLAGWLAGRLVVVEASWLAAAA